MLVFLQARCPRRISKLNFITFSPLKTRLTVEPDGPTDWRARKDFPFSSERGACDNFECEDRFQQQCGRETIVFG
jgi:hypothetical protein